MSDIVDVGRPADASGHAPVSNPAGTSGADDRTYWCQVATRLASPLLAALAKRQLKATMPIEAHPEVADRAQFTHLEGLGRLLAGIAPWLELGPDVTPEGRERGRLAALARAGIDAATDPASSDFMNFGGGRHSLIDAAYLAQAFVRAPRQLWIKLEPRVQRNAIDAMQSSRWIRPNENNWQLFATTIEVFLQQAGVKRNRQRLFGGLRRHRDWYVGDGTYGDGAFFQWDYYNSFVIHPMIVEALDAVGNESPRWRDFRKVALERLVRYAEIQERLIAPDGSYPAIGRSISYRCGAFQGLALAALRRMLPETIPPAQARVALTRVIKRTLEAPGTFDENGWLRIGLAGPQPKLGEKYISTGSLYMCSVALLPLGLPPTDAFWTAPPERTTWERMWSGENMRADKQMRKKMRFPAWFRRLTGFRVS